MVVLSFCISCSSDYIVLSLVIRRGSRMMRTTQASWRLLKLLSLLVGHALTFGLTPLGGVDIFATLFVVLVLLHSNGVGFGVRVVADAGHLPGHLHPRLAARYPEAVSVDFLGYV